ncbi:MAG: pantoate--beta-alanine ligase [Proteobacteria bacterium]|nr:pantoate--beta-alanine ligase [Pseudomonadota bacterium]
MSLEFIQSVDEMKTLSRSLKGSLGFVPTMGALHQGHISLIERSLKENAHTIVSIFVNPTQFNDPKDLEKYPRNVEEDLELLKGTAISAVFYPQAEDIYRDNFQYKIIENENSKILCGQDRPGHFDGVLTVVMKLLQIVKPTKAYFGEKDYQQLSLIQGMTKAFFMDTEIVACPTVRNEEGLALSSRNKNLNDLSLSIAPRFSQNLKAGLSLDETKVLLEKDGFEVLYLEEKWNRRFGAVKLDGVRLIDNVSL